jgi:translation initiation factor 2B subunit (eIF-2B alpha/beta/delta family)
MHPDIRAQIDQIAGDHLSGATDITRRAANILASLPVYSNASSTGDFRNELIDVARALAAAQPSMASLLSLVNRVLLAADKVRDFDQLLVTVEHEADDLAAALSRRPDQIARTALPLIPDDATVMTLSFSSAVFATLQRAHDAGKHLQVICLESRPQREGVALARQLAGLGIAVTLVVDAAMAHFMPRVGIVLFGADTISPEGLVNKIGTYALVLAADAHGVPAYALAGTDKFLPASLLRRFRVETKDPREILDEPAPAHLEVINLYFEAMPLDWVAGVVTEHEVLSPDEVEEQLEAIEVHSALLVD